MTLKARTVSDVSMEMEADDADQKTWKKKVKTVDEVQDGRSAFIGFAILAAGMSFGTYKYVKGPAAIAEQQEQAVYNHVAPAAVITMAVTMFFSVVGGVIALNKKVG